MNHMRKCWSLMVLMAVFLVFASTSMAVGPSAMIGEYGVSADPCLNHNTVKTSAAIAATSSSTAYVLVAKTTGKSIYVCDVVGALSGTTPTVLFSQGTKTSTECDTGSTNLSGVMAPSAGSMVKLGYGGTIIKTTAAKDLCVTTGSTSAFNGIITYVIQ